LLSSGRLEPRKVVGSIDTSEFLVAVGGSLGFLLALGSQGIDFRIAAALLVGGVIAAPLAAWLVKHLPARVLGVAAGGLIVVTNSSTITGSLGASGAGVLAVTTVMLVGSITLVVWAVRQERQARLVPQELEELSA
jgi:mannitol-specific phosphotransferase system IIBC component